MHGQQNIKKIRKVKSFVHVSKQSLFYAQEGPEEIEFSHKKR